ncbi:hypothetical protein LWI29_023323 [Acer saccharum]|uniref:TF-B3 domain-containing protein n=1 Tax=Acer saccharum TaxID=4024 RepID=A0AA39VWJ6_ACESA|nr:hypothetical protein LWI29_023323 [Acer saccharum]
MDTTEQVWTLRYYTRPSGNRKYPVFTVGWLEFVRVKRLRVGDELTFYGHQVRDTDGELRMQYGIQVVDSRSQKWKLRYYTRPYGKKIGPVFTAGWRRFVEAKRLRVGDALTFYGHQVRAIDGQLKMKYTVEVKRPSMTFNGEPVTSDVEYLIA